MIVARMEYTNLINICLAMLKLFTEHVSYQNYTLARLKCAPSDCFYRKIVLYNS